MRNHFAILLATMILVAPAAVAAWGAKGDSEPSTKLDLDDGWMHRFADTTPVATGTHKVYFSGFAGQPVCYTPCTSYGQTATMVTLVNPNVAQLQSGIHPYPFRPVVLMGVWKDCNNDGYLGFGDNGLFEYRSELLAATFGTSICLPQQLPTPIPKQNWFAPHNDGVWVHEFIPIGWDYTSAALDANPFNLNDSDARVWADWGVPGQKPPTTSCYVRPHPTGTYHSVGGLTAYADCFANGRIETAGSNGGAAWTTLKAVKNPWGEETDSSFVEPWDCAQPTTRIATPEQTLPGPSGPIVVAHQNVTNVSQPRGTPGTGTTGSPSGTMNSTMSGFDQCNRRTNVEGGGTGGGYARYAYQLEGDVLNQPGVRRQTDITFYFSEGQRPNPPWNGAGQLGRLAPPHLGTSSQSTEGFWVGDSITAASRNPYVNRDEATPMPVTYVSYYGLVGATAQVKFSLQLPKGAATGKYGFEACGVTTLGVKNGWDCDASVWWLDANGKDTRAEIDLSVGEDIIIGAIVGSPFNLRDVDCYDTSVAPARALGVHQGAITGTACA